MSCEKLNIKYMQLCDLDEICEIEAKAYGEHHWSRESFVHEIENNLAKYYVAKGENGQIFGYLGAWIIIDEAHITTLAVDPAHKRKKVAQSLMNCFIEDCYKNMVKYITLEVRVSNEPAINLYKKFGFNSLGTRKGYYQDNNEDALIMWTENIWHGKFKTLYGEILNAQERIEVCFES